MSWPWNPGQMSLKIIESGTFRKIGFGCLLVFYSNFVPKTHRFLDIRFISIPWPSNPGLGSLKVIKNDTVWSGIHDFLLTYHSNHRPISHRFHDKWRFQLKIANIPSPCVFNAPVEGFPLELGIGARGQKTRMMGLPGGRKSFKIGLTIQTQYWRVTDGGSDTLWQQRPR